MRSRTTFGLLALLSAATLDCNFEPNHSNVPDSRMTCTLSAKCTPKLYDATTGAAYADEPSMAIDIDGVARPQHVGPDVRANELS